MTYAPALYHHAGVARFYRSGETIFGQGEPAHEMYLVLEGAVELRRSERQPEFVGVGTILGAQALLDDGRYDATAVAGEPVALVPISAVRFAALIQQVPRFALDVIRTLADRSRAA